MLGSHGLSSTRSVGRSLYDNSGESSTGVGCAHPGSSEPRVGPWPVPWVTLELVRKANVQPCLVHQAGALGGAVSEFPCALGIWFLAPGWVHAQLPLCQYRI